MQLIFFISFIPVLLFTLVSKYVKYLGLLKHKCSSKELDSSFSDCVRYGRFYTHLKSFFTEYIFYFNFYRKNYVKPSIVRQLFVVFDLSANILSSSVCTGELTPKEKCAWLNLPSNFTVVWAKSNNSHCHDISAFIR